ncbi:hypothetical protein LPTSP4_32150 [Leptospira ryugenii]|uniref:Uncharacterized protein n=1 Tax=Leptospira ryugenii TaxID=1917863 RepID=A0A2P2E470_9LEPT|nr:hypothetical protein LPTSP4_32150 [Leptospira ryugenii]
MDNPSPSFIHLVPKSQDFDICSVQLEKDWNCFVQRISQDKDATRFISFAFCAFESTQLDRLAHTFGHIVTPEIPAFSPA